MEQKLHLEEFLPALAFLAENSLIQEFDFLSPSSGSLTCCHLPSHGSLCAPGGSLLDWLPSVQDGQGRASMQPGEGSPERIHQNKPVGVPDQKQNDALSLLP